MDKFADRYRLAAFALIAIVVLVLGFFVVQPFIPAILWATVLSVLMHPLHRRWTAGFAKGRWFQAPGVAESASALSVTLTALVLFLIPFVLIALGLYGQIVDIGEQLSASTDGQSQKLTADTVLRHIDASLQPIAAQVGAPKISLAEYFQQHAGEIVQELRQPVGRGVKTIGIGVLTFIIALLTMFFMVRDGHRLKQPVRELIPLPHDRTDVILNRVSETIFAVFIGTVLVAIIQGTIIGITYQLNEVPNALLLGVISIILCIVPLLGAPVIYIPTGLLLLSTGNTSGALWVLGVGFLVVSQIDNLLKPFLIGGRANLHPIATFFAVLGGVLFFGPIGVMAGPMVLTVLLAMQEIVRERIKLTEEGQQGTLPLTDPAAG